VALLGIGGVGKTALATEHAHRFVSHYDVIWWIAADQPALVRSSLAALAEPLGLESAATSGIEAAASAALNALRRGEPFSRWLLIFDHADQPEELNDMIPRGPGDVLITSRNITVDAFNREESRAFLPRRLPRGLAESEADQLADQLGHALGDHLPLPAAGGTAQHRTGLATVIRPALPVGTPRSLDEFRVPPPSKDATDQFERRAPWRIL
jgi:NB-ARC domain